MVELGGTASAVFVLSGGSQVVLSGGTASLTGINTGGVEIISAGGSDSFTGVTGKQDVFGAASNATVSAGGLQVVEVFPRADQRLLDVVSRQPR